MQDEGNYPLMDNQTLSIDSAHLIELLAYWESVSPRGLLPGREDLDPLSIPHILPFCELIDVHRDPLDFEYRLVGTKIDEISRQNYTGLKVSEIPTQNPPSLMYELYSRVTHEKKPVRAVLPYTGNIPRISEVESLVLPLACNGRDVDMLLGGIALK